MKACTLCRIEKPLGDFQKIAKDGVKRRARCRACVTKKHNEWVENTRKDYNSRRRAKYQANKVPAIAHNLKRYYGLSLEEYDRLLASQGGRCKICGDHQDKHERRFDVDHCHTTGKIRGLLCIRCNRGIGLLKDSVEILQAAIRHLTQGQELGDKKPLG